MANVANEREVAAAQAFLRFLGANWRSNLLIIAVVAWMRQESGGLSHVIGNNPFNLRPGADDAMYRSGIRKSKNGNGHFSVYATLENGLVATANRLLKAGNDWRGYGLIVRAARAGSPVDFLTAIALSAWDAGHYGLPKDNHLLRVYASFTGLKLPAPKSTEPKPTKAARKIPPAPAVLRAPNLEMHYLDGYDSGRFYRERHKSDDILQD